MSFLGIKSRIRRKKVNHKISKPDYVKENILGRDFTISKPNEKWLTNITQFSIPSDIATEGLNILIISLS
ncbi:hypothetical protein Z962_09475 [Clostridium botulinum C/D str. BKT12695]|nr:hypothetical protein Z962_09475 [Clostridium botulinum C/D str. BKT12695]